MLASTTMKYPMLLLLGIGLTACGDDGTGLSDGDSSSGGSGGGTATTSDSTASTSGSDGVDVDTGSTSGGVDTTDGEDTTDPTPILEREPIPTHDCEETRPMSQQAEGFRSSRYDALVTIGSEYFALRSSETLVLANMALDGTLGDEVVLEDEPFLFTGPTATAVDSEIVAVWTYNASSLRYAAVDDALGVVVAPKQITGIGGMNPTAAALVPTASGGVVLLYGESGAGGQTTLRFVELDPNGDPVAAPVDVADVGASFGTVSASAAATPDGGYAVAHTRFGELGQAEVDFVVLDADGTPRFEPRRISREASDGLTSALGYTSRRSLLPVGDRYWVTFSESELDYRLMQGHVVVQVAIVDGDGNAELHPLQAPDEGRNNLWPSFVELDGQVGLMWTTGTIIWICGGCISDNDLNFVLIDPEEVAPASNVVTQLHDMNGITAPLGAFVGSDMLTVSSLDFHALTQPASGSLRCEAQ
jgi:hypothetical protein